MVKLHCDRCGKEIVGKHYHTINIYKEDINPKHTITDYAEALSSVASSLQENLLAKLNSYKMYCDECIDDIKYFINNGESKEDAELRELSDFANLSD